MLLLLACTSAKPGTSQIISQESSLTNDTADHDTGDPPPDPDQSAKNLSSGPGDFAADFLTADYLSLKIEVDWVAGHSPDSAALQSLADNLDRLCNKPGGIEVILDDEIPDQGSPTWSYQQAEDTEVVWRDLYRDPDQSIAILYYLYLDGHSEFDSDEGKILGYAYHGSSLIMFEETMASVGVLGLGGVEESVLLHEAGHILGLVNNGVPMETNHEDPSNKHHDVSDNCIMYWAAETDAIADLLGSGTLDFDQECLADLKAAGGR